MAAVTQSCRHLQALLPAQLAPSTTRPSAKAADGRTTRQRLPSVQRSVCAAAAKRSKSGGSMREQLQELLVGDQAAGTEAHSEAVPGRSRKKRSQGGGVSGRVDRAAAESEQDVEIYSIDKGWSKDAYRDADGDGLDLEAALKTEGMDLSHVEGLDLSDLNLDGLDFDDFDEADDDYIDDGDTEWKTDNFDDSVFASTSASSLELEEGSVGSNQGSSAAMARLVGGRGGEEDRDDDEDEDGTDDEEDDVKYDDAGWTVSDVPDDYRVEKPSQGSKLMRETEVGPAMQSLLDSIPPEMLRKIRKAEQEAESEEAATSSKALVKAAARRRTHRRLRIISGSAGGKRLLSPQGDVVRPMMEMVKAAVFSMIQARLGGSPTLPEGSRWLDLYAGTGNIGLEALSRGCNAASFIELDPWVSKACLQRNIAICGMESAATVYTTKAESFMARASRTPGFAGGAFDFISVCPPYLLVSYPELFGLLEAGGLAKPTSIILVEYPKRLGHQIPDTLCGLRKVKDRKYGRTFLALFAPADPSDEEDKDNGVWQNYI